LEGVDVRAHSKKKGGENGNQGRANPNGEFCFSLLTLCGGESGWLKTKMTWIFTAKGNCRSTKERFYENKRVAGHPRNY